MARLARLTIPGYPYHVLHRGHNRQPIFTSSADRQMMLDLLADSAVKFGLSVHAYVLMDNHLHLLATPRSANALSLAMQSVGRRYVRYFNDSHQRSGTLWEGRYRSALLQSDRFLLPCMVYFDLNAVRAGLVAQAQEYAWSSYGHYAGLRNDKLITPHPRLWELGNTPFAREAVYRLSVEAGVSGDDQAALTDSVMSGWALGDAQFVERVQKMTARRLTRSSPGRPPKPG